MKKLNKVLSLVLLLFLVISIVPESVQAKKKPDKELLIRIQQGLDGIVYQKNELGLGDVDFNSLKVGHIIHAYEFVEEQMNELNFTVYPLFDKKQLVAFAIDCPGDDTVSITTQLVDELKDYSGNKKPFALVYDQNSCYLYNKKDMKLLNRFESDSAIKRRGKLNLTKDSIKLQQCERDFDTDVKMDAIPDNNEEDGLVSIMSSTYYSCPVSCVRQEDVHWCWVASVSCVGEYKTGMHFTQKKIGLTFSMEYDPSGSVYIGRPLIDATTILNELYGLNYSVKNHSPNVSDMYTGISNNNPIMMGYVGLDMSNHEMVGYAVNTRNNIVYVMDPEYGFSNSHWNNDFNMYHYTSLKTGNNFYATECSY